MVDRLFAMYLLCFVNTYGIEESNIIMTNDESKLLTEVARCDPEAEKAFVNAVSTWIKSDNDYYVGPPRYYYKVKPNGWFDAGTTAKLIDDYSNGTEGRVCGTCGRPGTECGWGLFEGLKDGKLDEEVCNMCEFEEPTI